MIKTYLKCEICGDEWNITDLPYSRNINPGVNYTNDCVFEGKRHFTIEKLVATTDCRIELSNMDICDRCYLKIDRFINDLREESENG